MNKYYVVIVGSLLLLHYFSQGGYVFSPAGFFPFAYLFLSLSVPLFSIIPLQDLPACARLYLEEVVL